MHVSKPEPIVIRGGRVLAADGPSRPAALVLERPAIAAIEPPATPARGGFDVDGALVLPGIVDLHGDAFERELMPRPGVRLPIAAVLLETDRRLVGSGVTTAFHGVSYSFEPGLRGRDSALDLLAAIERLQDRFACDSRIHLRHEIFNIDGVADILGWLAERRIDLLAFNDHLSLLQTLASSEKVGVYAGRAGMSIAAFHGLLAATAVAVGLNDRGVIAAGRRADLIVVDDRDPANPVVLATFVAGRPVYGAGVLAASPPLAATALTAAVP